MAPTISGADFVEWRVGPSAPDGCPITAHGSC